MSENPDFLMKLKIIGEVKLGPRVSSTEKRLYEMRGVLVVSDSVYDPNLTSPTILNLWIYSPLPMLI